MKVQFVTILAACLLPMVWSQGSTVAWCYNLPSCNYTTWSTISPAYCNGSHQSPINIVTANVQSDANLTAFTFSGFNDSSAVLQIENINGKYVEVILDDTKVNVSGGGLPGLYKTLQFHFHWGNGSTIPGSEHSVDGKKYPMEMHIVSFDSSFPNLTTALGNSTGLAVLGFFIEATNDSGKPQSWKNLTSYLSNITNKGFVLDIMGAFTMDSLLQGVDRTKYYRYLGSLTTPTCNEAVVWTIFKDTIKVSQDLINLFSTTVFVNTSTNGTLITNNYRGVQPLNNRVVTSQPPASASAPYQALSMMAALLCCVLYPLL